MNLRDPAWREQPARTVWRIATSLIRRRCRNVSWRRPLVAYDNGRSRIVADLDTPTGLQLYRYGLRHAEIDLAAALLRPGDTFVDGGANIGLFSLVAAARVGPGGQVIAFEPGHEAACCLERNLHANRFSWAQVRRQALADAPGHVEFVAFGGAASGLSSFAPPLQVGGGARQQVETVTLDDALGDIIHDPARRARLSLIKLDLEGAEYAALRGAGRLLDMVAPDFLVEIEPDHLARQNASAAQIADLFAARGYAAYTPVHAVSPAGAGHDPLLQIAPCIPHERGSAQQPSVYFTKNIARAREAGIRVAANAATGAG